MEATRQLQYTQPHFSSEKKRKMKSKKSQPPPPQQTPWLVFLHGEGERTQTFLSVKDGTFNDKSIPEMHNTVCLASYFGWLVMYDKKEDLFLLHSVSLQKIPLPSPSSKLISRSLQTCVLSSPPTESDCVVWFLGGFGHALLFYCYPGGDGWYQCKYRNWNKNPIDHVVSCNGKIYCERSWGMWGIIDVIADPDHPITWLGRIEELEGNPEELRAVYLVESCGHVFIVRIYYFVAVSRVTHFSVHKYDFAKKTLVKVDTLGDRVFFVGCRGSISCSASATGMTKDCIYFMKSNDTSLYVFHLDRGSISVHLTCPHVGFDEPWDPVWVMPLLTN